MRNVNNRLRALPGACVRSPAADPGLESGVDGPPAGIPLVDLLGLLAGDPGQVPHGPAYIDQVLLLAPFDQGVQVARHLGESSSIRVIRWPASSWSMTLSATCSALALSSGDASSLTMALIVKTHEAGRMLMKKAGRDVGAPALQPGDLDQVGHRLPHVLWDAKGAPHRTLAEQRI